MERLTARNKKGLAYLKKVKPDEQEVNSAYPNTLKAILEGMQRLADYEDAGLTPEEITHMTAEYNKTLSCETCPLDSMRWISVEDRLPEHRKSVLVYCPEFDNIYCADYRSKEDDIFSLIGKWFYFEQGVGNIILEEVTHWMALPRPPKGEE